MADAVELTIKLVKYSSSRELPDQLHHLLESAKLATNKAYAPYSDFYVGAAVLLDDGQIVTGNNQENIAFPSGMCAERVALFHAQSNYPDKKIEAIAITARSKNGVVDKPITPCGGCRQVMVEYEDKQKKSIQVVLSGETGEIFVSENVLQFIPFYFDSELVKPSEK